tara:strand:- start:633 stop:887 length:255 start_codon:yes stop_codon:yes gene_type:complete
MKTSSSLEEISLNTSDSATQEELYNNYKSIINQEGDESDSESVALLDKKEINDIRFIITIMIMVFSIGAVIFLLCMILVTRLFG